MAETGFSRATVYRDLAILRDAGVPVGSEGDDGPARHRLLTAPELPPIGLSALQIAALQRSFRFGPQPPSHPAVLKVLDSAIRSRRRARLEYRAASRGGAPALIHVEPLVISVARGEPYLRAFWVERGEERTYKIARIARAAVTEQRATYRRKTSTSDAFAHAIKVWTGEPEVVRIQLDAAVAWLAPEYPLPGQRITRNADGSIVIEARVSGLIDARRWVLSWGGAAEALDPAALRDATRVDLATALAKYDRPGPAKAAPEKSIARRRSRLTDRAIGRT